MRRIASKANKTSKTRFVSVLAQLPTPRSVLELGCGDDPEAALYFSGSGIRVLGLDQNLDVLRSVRDYYPRLLQADITRLPLKTQFDLMIARHPDIDRRQSDWYTALTTADNWLLPDGILLITLYSAGEYEQVRSWLRSSSLKPYPLLPSNLIPPALDGRDRFIMVYSAFKDTIPQ